MEEFDELFVDREPISIQPFLEELDLPKRLKNYLKSSFFYCEEDFFKEVEKLSLRYTSYYLFPGEMVAFYPQVCEFKAKEDILCNLSGSVIRKDSFYYCYHPFMENLNNGRVYTIRKNIKAELSYIDCFPQDLFTYEEWYYHIKNAYYSVKNDSMIDFYSLATTCGENCLEPYLLGLSKKKKKV